MNGGRLAGVPRTPRGLLERPVPAGELLGSGEALAPLLPNAFNVTLEVLATPIGEVVLATTPSGQLLSLEFAEKIDQVRRYVESIGYDRPLDASVATTSASRRVSAYFDGEVEALGQIDVVVHGSNFRRRALTMIRAIAPGQTRSYKAIACALGNAAGARAVARVAATNPLTLVVPCHRVVGAAGDLTGYGAGIDRKRWLLDHEARFAGDLGPAECAHAAG